jgi:high affinity choline transporter 7
MKKPIIPVTILSVLLLAVGLYVHYFTPAEVYWSGYIAMMVFYALIFYYGAYAANLKKDTDATDVMLAGRNIPLWIAIFTMSATWVGGGFINGTAEATANPDSGLMWVQAPWGYALSLVVGGLFFARKMRHFQFKTMLDPLEQRFGKRMAALLFLPALTGEIFWTSAILTALGTTFATVLGLDFNSSIILSATVAVAYTALGGLWAVALTDIIQMTLLMIGLVLVLPFAANTVGGWEVVFAKYNENVGDLATFFPSHEILGNYFYNWWDYALLLVFGGVAWQVYFQRVLSAKTGKIAVQLSIIAGVVCILAAIPAMLIGMIGNAADWASMGLEPLGGENTPYAVTLPYVMKHLTNPVVATIGLGAIAAAVMSSVDSSILSASSMASWNVIRPLIKPNISMQSLSKVIKGCIWIIGIAATLIALQVKSIYALWFLCSDFVYCILFPQLVAALFDKKANVWGSAIGFAVSFILRFGGGEPTLGIPTTLPYPMIEEGVVLFPFRTLAMVSGLVMIIVVSRLTQKISPPKVLEIVA